MTDTAPPLTDFPEVHDWQVRCLMCKLIRDEPGLARVVHAEYRSRRGEDGVASPDAVVGAVAGMLAKHGVKPISAQSLERHFLRHVDWSLAAAKLGAPATQVAPETHAYMSTVAAALQEADPKVGALGKNDADYFRMNELFMRLMGRIVALDKDPTAFFTEDSRHDMHKLNVWTGMISAARGVLSDLNKMRNGDRLTASILDQHTLHLAQSLSAGLGEELRPVQAALARGDSDTASRLLSGALSERVPALFRAAVEESLDHTKTKYGLLQ